MGPFVVGRREVILVGAWSGPVKTRFEQEGTHVRLTVTPIGPDRQGHTLVYLSECVVVRLPRGANRLVGQSDPAHVLAELGRRLVLRTGRAFLDFDGRYTPCVTANGG